MSPIFAITRAHPQLKKTSQIKASKMDFMRKYLIAGLLFWTPIWVTYVVLRFVVNLLDESLALLPAKYQPDQLFGWHIPGLGLAFTIGIIFLTGLLVANLIGARVVELWESLLARIPLIRGIHAASKQVLNAFVQPKSDSFRKVVLVEFPRPGVYAIGFQTANTLSHWPTPEPVIAVFVPTSPNPTSGFLMYVPANQVKLLNISVEEAFKIILSVGVVSQGSGETA